MIDYSADLYDPVYAALGVPATLTAGASTVTITVIDETRRKTITSGAVEVTGVGPGAFARMPELTANGITADNWDGSQLAFNGRTWIVRKGEVLGSPNGEDLGEVRFLLTAIAVETGLPAAPAGSAYLLNAAGEYLINADGAYILAKV